MTKIPARYKGLPGVAFGVVVIVALVWLIESQQMRFLVIPTVAVTILWGMWFSFWYFKLLLFRSKLDHPK